MALDPPPRLASPPELDSTCPCFELYVNLKGHLVASGRVQGRHVQFIVDSGANMSHITHASTERLDLVDCITSYSTVRVQYTEGEQEVLFGWVPAVGIEFPQDISVVVELAVLPPGFKRPNVNLLPIQFLRCYGCVIDFREEKPRIFFRETSKHVLPYRYSSSSEFLRLTVKGKTQKLLGSNSHKLLLDTGCGASIMDRRLYNALCADKHPGAGFDLLLFRDPSGNELVAHRVALGDIGSLNFLLGTDFLLRHRAVCDFGAMELYVQIGSLYYCIDLAAENLSNEQS